MRVLRSHGSLFEAPPETLTPPEVFTPSAVDVRPKNCSASTNSSSSVKKSRTRLSLLFSSASPPINVPDSDSVGKRKRSARVSYPGCYSNESKKQCLRLRSGLRIPRRRLSISSDMDEKEEGEMVVGFKEGDLGDVPEVKDETIRETPEDLIAEDQEVYNDADRHMQEEENVEREMDHSSQTDGYLSLRSGSQVRKRNVMHVHVETHAVSKDVDKFVLRERKVEEELGLSSEYVDKSGDKMLMHMLGIVNEETDKGRYGKNKTLEKLVLEDNRLGIGSDEIYFATNGVGDTDGRHFSNVSEMERGGSICSIIQDKGLGESTFEDVVRIGRPGIDSDVDPVSEKRLNKEILVGDRLICQTRSRRYSSEVKRKGKVALPEIQETEEQKVSTKEEEFNNTNRPKKQIGSSNANGRSRRDTYRDNAIQLAPRFAYFKADDGKRDEESESDDSLPNANEEDWPGPFSTAMKVIEEREKMLRMRDLNSYLEKNGKPKVKIHWTPSNVRKTANLGKLAPSLKDLCLNVLYENVEEVESLEGLPDAIKHKLVFMLCYFRRMSSHVLGLLTKGSPAEICISNCSWATDRQFEEVFSQCDMTSLKVLQLNFCGRCLPDYVLHSTLTKAFNCLPLLSRLSLKGAYGLSDGGLAAIIDSAPLLRSVDISQCSLLTHMGINFLADKLETMLIELYIADCQSVDAMLIVPALQKLKCLEVLSVARMETVTDRFLKKLLPISGAKIRELALSGCCKLTNASMKAIAENCPWLCCLDIRYLNWLNDSALQHLGNVGRPFQKLEICLGAFSDEATAAFLEACGSALEKLALNNIQKVAEHTALAISHSCQTLRYLDLSFCRKMTDEALGLIVDSCLQLRELKLFGCTQITDVFLEGHSNLLLKIIGLRDSILEEVQAPEFY